MNDVYSFKYKSEDKVYDVHGILLDKFEDELGFIVYQVKLPIDANLTLKYSADIIELVDDEETLEVSRLSDEDISVWMEVVSSMYYFEGLDNVC